MKYTKRFTKEKYKSINNETKAVIADFLNECRASGLTQRTVAEVVKITNVKRGTIFGYLSEFVSKKKSEKLLLSLIKKSKAENTIIFKVDPKLYLTYSTEFEVLSTCKKIQLNIKESDIGQIVYVVLN